MWDLKCCFTVFDMRMCSSVFILTPVLQASCLFQDCGLVFNCWETEEFSYRPPPLNVNESINTPRIGSSKSIWNLTNLSTWIRAHMSKKKTLLTYSNFIKLYFCVYKYFDDERRLKDAVMTRRGAQSHNMMYSERWMFFFFFVKKKPVVCVI